jgi:hypothetical protein
LWPSNVGSGFAALVEQTLQVPDIPLSEGNLEAIEQYNWRWREGAILRERLLVQSHGIMRRRGGESLRRGDLLQALGIQMGWSIESPMPDSETLLRAARSDRQYPIVRDALKVISECYHCNQARQFSCRPSFPVYDPLTQLIISNDSKPVEAEKSAPSGHKVLQFETKIPSFDSLMARSPIDLVRIRNEYGVEHRASIAAWQRCPCDKHEARVERALKGYTTALDRWCGDSKAIDLSVTHTSGRDIAWKAIKTSGTVGVAAGGVAWPVIPLFAAIGAAGASIYSIVNKLRGRRRGTTPVRITIDGTSVSTEVVERRSNGPDLE